MNEPKVLREQAENEFDQMCEVVGIENDVEDMEPEDAAQFNDHKKRIVKGIMSGQVIMDVGMPTVLTLDGDKVTFIEPTGATYMVPMGKNDTEVHRMYKMAGELTKGKAGMAKRKKRDYVVLMSLTALFISM